ncbi:acyltransferase family protein [Thermomonospora umbrina]|uniref:Peptidoglycan/LPS O-acetylase OafA/YrhL n=1 Tax=Thermomonospora umbrina TaxID=111806 RepID=A0A3D9T137_9ACTN|nr:acyltransferase [Thermomonospora umbrina]REE98514.1 peptidoglycan/LPS O-acetylase OafA/YrhL [Thermomonospora umbrina]
MTRIVPVQRPGAPQVSGHQNSLDGVRAVAALSVLVFHVALNAGAVAQQIRGGWAFNGGQVGVAVFFVLSGLLLYRPWAHAALGGRPAPHTGDYLLKRALRILPAYWVLVVAVMVFAHRDHLTDGGALLGLLTLTHIYFPQDWWANGLGPREIGQVWSLAVEAAFYVTLPATAALLARFARRGTNLAERARRLLTAIGAYGMISFVFTIVMYVPDHHPSWGVWPLRYTAWFGVGMAFAVLTVWAREDPRSPAARFCRTIAGCWGTCWLAALCLLLIAASPITGPLDLDTTANVWTSTLHILVFGACAAFFVGPAALAPAHHPVMSAALGNPFMQWLGRISYGVFLWQMVVILAWYEATGRLFNGNLVTDLFVLSVGAVLAGAAGYHLTERPVQTLYRPKDRAAGT